ncbi:MAG: DUF61 family protein [Methanomethylophilus sp.]|jgi:uncharacterized protein (UPF0216 family)
MEDRYGIEQDPRDPARLFHDMNANLPVARRSLDDYIENGDLTYKTRSGETVEFPKEGIDLLDSFCTYEEKILLKLPLLITTDISGEVSCWKIDGTTETAVISRLLKRRVHSEDRLVLYYPDLAELKKLLPGLVFPVFTP